MKNACAFCLHLKMRSSIFRRFDIPMASQRYWMGTTVVLKHSNLLNKFKPCYYCYCNIQLQYLLHLVLFPSPMLTILLHQIVHLSHSPGRFHNTRIFVLPCTMYTDFCTLNNCMWLFVTYIFIQAIFRKSLHDYINYNHSATFSNTL